MLQAVPASYCSSCNVWHTMNLQWSTCNHLVEMVYLRCQFSFDRNNYHIITYELSYESPGADTGFWKGGGPGNCSTKVLKRVVFAHTTEKFFPSKFGGPPKGGVPDPQDPPALDPPLKAYEILRLILRLLEG